MVIVISAPSGSGKTTLINRLLSSSRRYVKSVSVTTRPPRRGETDGVDYFFMTEKEFLRLRDNGGFLEWAVVLGRHYGTPASFVENALAEGKDVILNIDVRGAMKVRKMKRMRSVFIFVKPPSEKALKERLKGRKTDSAEEIRRRIELSKKEMAYADRYDYIVVNRTIDESIKKIKSIIAKGKNGGKCV
ncbi:MAG: guanylate kinase [Candidatus Omnitrophica bacterium CG1_02_49_10]|nr:MAG: guanylate kinase [Candidatus Omnitrophica bacterium CG1_02_49_10]